MKARIYSLPRLDKIVVFFFRNSWRKHSYGCRVEFTLLFISGCIKWWRYLEYAIIIMSWFKCPQIKSISTSGIITKSGIPFSPASIDGSFAAKAPTIPIKINWKFSNFCWRSMRWYMPCDMVLLCSSRTFRYSFFSSVIEPRGGAKELGNALELAASPWFAVKGVCVCGSGIFWSHRVGEF